MIAVAERFVVCARLRQLLRISAYASSAILFWVVACGWVYAQSSQKLGGDADGSSSVHGTVLNRVTHEPIGGALVYSSDERYATLTDDRGHFEFTFSTPEAKPEQNSPVTGEDLTFRNVEVSRGLGFLARKPGFIEDEGGKSPRFADPVQSEVTIYLEPQSLIVGRVDIPGSVGDSRVRVQLFRRRLSEGREQWVPAGNFRTWADGEFRFFNLVAGAYKLVTDEQLDRDQLTSVPGQQVFGFPPVFYPGASSFSDASTISLGPGATFQANLTVSREAYYPVKIPVLNAVAGQFMGIRVYPLGNPGPGYSLAYNPGDQTIQGFLPDGNYTVQAQTAGESDSTGIQNLSVHGAPYEGPSLNLIPNTSVAVILKEVLESSQRVFQDDAQEPPDGQSDSARNWRADARVTLTPIDQFGLAQANSSQPVKGSPDHALAIQNVRPGSYRVSVDTWVGYAATVVAGEIDLLHQPLVVGMGGSTPPIEVTLRDDGAEVDGTLENGAKPDAGPNQSDDDGLTGYVYFVPVAGTTGQFRATSGNVGESFMLEQLPPGTYRVVVFDHEREDLASGSEEAMRESESKGQLLQVAAGQKLHLNLKIVPGGDPQ